MLWPHELGGVAVQPSVEAPWELTSVKQDGLVTELAERPRHQTGRALFHLLLVDGLDADNRDNDFEEPTPEVHGRIVEIGVR